MWIYTDSLSYDENPVFELSEWLKPKAPSESSCVAVMGKEDEEGRLKKMQCGGVR